MTANLIMPSASPSGKLGRSVMLDQDGYYLYFVFHSQRLERIMLDFIVKYSKFNGDCEVITDYDELKKLYNDNLEEIFKVVREAIYDSYQPVID